MTNTTTNDAAGRTVRLLRAHQRRVRTGGQYSEANMGLLVAMQRAERVWGVR